jgi:hypothetical protein
VAFGCLVRRGKSGAEDNDEEKRIRLVEKSREVIPKMLRRGEEGNVKINGRVSRRGMRVKIRV